MLEEILDRVLAWEAAAEVAREAGMPGGGSINTTGSLVPLLAAAAYRSIGGPMLVAVGVDPARIARDIGSFLPGEVYHLTAGGTSEDIFSPYAEGIGQRMKAARALMSGKVAVAGPRALLEGVPAALPEPWPLEIAVAGRLELEEILRLLVEGGYRREYTVEGWGHFALRGGILDIFPSTSERPVRVELVGDVIESLREFNVVTQRSSDRLERVEVFPASDLRADPRRTPGRADVTVLAVDPPVIEARIAEFSSDGGFAGEDGSALDGLGRVVRVDTLGTGGDGGAAFPGVPAKEFRGDLAAAVREWRSLLSGGSDVFLLLEGEGQARRARELWEEEGSGGRPPCIGVGSLSRGFTVGDLRITLFTSHELVGSKERVRRARKTSSGAPVTSYAELETGGFVVHADQGIGVYRGLTSREVLGVRREYLLLEYAGGDRLYVPTSQLAKVQRYVGGESPTVHRLRGREWSRARKMARRSAEKTARELLQLYMERKTRPGHAFSPDTPWQAELEDSFAYEDTPDQSRAAREAKEDMESPVAMDRLVCGDVGFGKTEVAVRAAMKAAMDSKQVAVLVPTTVLARQHYETFSERLAPFPVRVAMLSRFLSRAEQEAVAASLGRGETDVVIGTHRLLSDDVSFRDLGLLVIDEEQKFGVTDKEKLRRLRRNVDTLTLTATPIPRTLQMSLSGVRDVSIIDTPPEDRHPISTYVGEFDRDLAARAVRHEIARRGQVFYVHNRIGSINRVAKTLTDALGGISVAVAHGRMDEERLERVMLDFADGSYDVLVCTTIIESGLDLPNVNTLIVDRAERLGLAQLYQIRGRVGRSEKRAFAYLFYPARESLTDTAVARLATISEMTPLGSGMRVAMRDLEIRGAGSLLGAEQSGQIEAVGFEMYCELLKEAVDILKGQPPAPASEAAVELPIDAYIPEDYISEEETRVEMYRRLAAAGLSGTVEEFSLELEDRFGDIPTPVQGLIELEGLRRRTGEAGFENVTSKGNELQLKYYPGFKRAAARASRFAAESGISAPDGGYMDVGARTLYLKLRFEGVNNRQQLLLKWLNSIIDDILGDADRQNGATGRE